MTLQEVYERHADFVWRALRRLGVPDAALKDATHDVFLVVHAQLGRFEGRSSLTTWLFTLCRTVARERRRRERRERELLDSSNVEEEIDLRADVAREAEHHERLSLLENLLAGLEVEQRNVFILFEIERLTGEEIAEMLTIPLGTVYSRLQLGRAAFRQALTRREARERFVGARAGGTRP
jgi:RNA polymerase sigma-70 factor (ECF subfamily)